MKIEKIKFGWLCEFATFSIFAFSLTDLLQELKERFNIIVPLFEFKNLN